MECRASHRGHAKNLHAANTASMVSEELLSETDNAENTENGSASEEKKCSCQLDISDQVEIVHSEPNVIFWIWLNMRLTVGSGSRKRDSPH